jgi:hybrid cluster-associated redox disulfide protein
MTFHNELFARGADMITRDMIIADIIMQHPETLQVFKRYNLDCYECQIADLETLEHGAGVHKVAIDELLDALNRSLA